MNRRDESRDRGAGIIEYVLIAALIAVAAIVGISAVGTATASSMTDVVDAFGEPVSAPTTISPVTQEENVETAASGTVRFEEVDGRVRFGAIDAAEGWKVKVTKDNGVRSTVRLTSTENGQRVIVTGWINKKGQLKTKVTYK